MLSKRVALSFALLFVLLLGAALTSPVLACQEGEMMIPKSASADGQLAEFIRANHTKDVAAIRGAMKALPLDQQQQIKAEFQALPKEERRALGKALRDGKRPSKTKPSKQ